MSNPYGNPFGERPAASRKQSAGGASLYDLIPPGWESGASVEELRKRQTDQPTMNFIEQGNDGFEAGTTPTEDVHVDDEGETESKEEQGWILPEEKEPTKQESGFTEVHSEPVSREPTRDVSLTTDDEEDKDKPSSLMMTVGEYTKHGEGMGSFVSYKVNVKTNLVQYHKSEFTTDRRYNDFVWLFDKMKESFKGYIIPPLPDKTIIQNRFDPQFIEARRRELGKFLTRLADHPVLAASEVLQTFLESDAEEFSAAKTKKPPATVTKKVFSWMSSTVTQQLSPAVEVDTWFGDKKQYLQDLESALEACLKTSGTVLVKEKELVGALYEFGLGASAVGKAEAEVDPTLSKHWLKFGDLCEQVRVLKQEAVSSQEIRFEEVAHDYRRVIASAKQAMEARLTALAEFQHAEKIANTKKEKKEKIAGTPKAGTAEAEYEEARQKQESAKEEFEMISEILRKELDRFEKTKGKEMSKSLKDYAKENMDTTVQILDQWKKLLNQLQTASI